MESAEGVKYAAYTKGPQRLGDPDDETLRKIERTVKIPQKMRVKARTEKCADLVKEFEKCGKEYGLRVFYKCRDENKVMQECLGKWFNDPEFKEECTKEYLAERAEYRRTGITVIPSKLHR